LFSYLIPSYAIITFVMNAETITFLAFALFFGLVIGSFLNVLIYRLPNKMPFVMERSICPSCKSGIAWYDNIPLLSFVVLRARCRKCGTRISWHYPMVEFLNGILYVAVVYKELIIAPAGYQPVLRTVSFLFFVSALIAISFIDARHHIIPNKITYTGLIIGPILLLSADPSKIFFYLSGLLIGGGYLLLVDIAWITIKKTEGMGFGDVKLGAMLGVFLGWPVFIAIFFASLTGIIYNVGASLLKKQSMEETLKTAFGFGPFLAIGGILTYFAGTWIISAYFSIF